MTKKNRVGVSEEEILSPPTFSFFYTLYAADPMLIMYPLTSITSQFFSTVLPWAGVKHPTGER